MSHRLWVDGSYLPGVGAMGAGYVLWGDGFMREGAVRLGQRPADSGRAEILAAAVGLEQVPPGAEVELMSDHTGLLTALAAALPLIGPEFCLLPDARIRRRLRRCLRGAKCEDWKRLFAAASGVRLVRLVHTEACPDSHLLRAHALAQAAAYATASATSEDRVVAMGLALA